MSFWQLCFFSSFRDRMNGRLSVIWLEAFSANLLLTRSLILFDRANHRAFAVHRRIENASRIARPDKTFLINKGCTEGEPSSNRRLRREIFDKRRLIGSIWAMTNLIELIRRRKHSSLFERRFFAFKKWKWTQSEAINELRASSAEEKLKKKDKLVGYLIQNKSQMELFII